MSKTLLTIITASVLAALSVGVMMTRHLVLGKEVRQPANPGAWKVALVVKGQASGEARLTTAIPLDFDQQHISNETYRSEQLAEKPPDLRHSDRRQVIWTKRADIPDGPFRARYEFFCTMDMHRPTSPMSRLANALYAPPHPGQYLDAPSRNISSNDEIAAKSATLTEGLERQADQARTLFNFVENEIDNEPSLEGTGMTAAECLKHGSSGSGGKSRLLVALLRSTGIPARLVTGLRLTKTENQLAHHWVEAWIDDHWLPMCPYFQYYGHVPATYLIFGFGDLQIVRGKQIKELEYAFTVDRTSHHDDAAADPSTIRRIFKSMSMLTGPQQREVRFLLLLPVAALLICIYRNIIGLSTFGTFAPALVGLAFRDEFSMHQGLIAFFRHCLPILMVFVGVLLVGWVMRRALDFYHILQVPRVAFMLSLVVSVLIAVIVVANQFHHIPSTDYIALFPLVILTGMVERFWTLEVEDSAASSFKTLMITIAISLSIAVLLSIRGLASHMFCYPETLGLVMAVQLLIGRYTGFRLNELYRFRDFLKQPAGLTLQR